MHSTCCFIVFQMMISNLQAAPNPSLKIPKRKPEALGLSADFLLKKHTAYLSCSIKYIENTPEKNANTYSFDKMHIWLLMTVSTFIV